MTKGGLSIFCPTCQTFSVCAAISPHMLGLSKARRWKNINHSDIQWFRRARECRVCKHRFTTAEINEELLNEIVELRERLAERNANMSQELLELQKRLAEQNKELFNHVRRNIPWIVREEVISLELAEEFIKESTWWLTHSSGNPVRAPGHARNIYKSHHGWTLELGANKFLVGKAIERCRNVINDLFDKNNSKISPTSSNLIKILSHTISGAVANCNNDEYEDFYPITDGQLIFGATAIDVNDAVTFLIRIAEIATLLI